MQRINYTKIVRDGLLAIYAYFFDKKRALFEFHTTFKDGLECNEGWFSPPRCSLSQTSFNQSEREGTKVANYKFFVSSNIFPSNSKDVSKSISFMI